MPNVSADQIKLAREVDLLSYLQAAESHELRRAGPNEYRTATHGSLVISNGFWCWNRGQVGGRSALDYLIKVRGMGFVEAVERVLGSRAAPVPLLPVEKERARKAFVLPPTERFASHALAYLQGRGISPALIGRCIRDGTIYESRDKGKAVCVFVGRDGSDAPRFAHMRGIYEKYHRDADGSDKRFSFCLPAKDPGSRHLALFESPIDLLSHVTLQIRDGWEWDGYRLSLGGTSPVALTAFLEWDPKIANISLCLDSDEAGQTAALKIRDMLAERYPHITVTIDPPDIGKDYNDMLLHAKALEKERNHTGHQKVAGVSL